METLIPLLALLLTVKTTSSSSVSSYWGRTNYLIDPENPYRRVSYVYKTFKEAKVFNFNGHRIEAEGECSKVSARLPTLKDISSNMFIREVADDAKFWRLSLLQSIGGKQDWISDQPSKFFISTSASQYRLVKIEMDDVQVRNIFNDRRKLDVGEQVRLTPTLILCVREEFAPTTTQPPTLPPMKPTCPPLTSCDCSKASRGQESKFFLPIWFLLLIGGLCALCISLLIALLVSCRRNKLPKASTGQTASSLFIDYQAEKGSTLPPPGGATISRRPKVIHYGQVPVQTNNGYLTLGSIQARKQREMEKYSEPPSPNHSLARSDFYNATMPLR